MVAANVNWKPTSNRLKGLTRSRAKALRAMALRTWASFQNSRPARKATVMMTARRTDGLPSTSRA